MEAILLRAQALDIQDDSDLELAALDAQTVARGKQVITEFFRPMKKATDEAHKAVVRQEKGLLSLWERADILIRGRMTDYKVRRDERREKERALLEKQARDKAADEQLAKAVQLETLGKATGDERYLKAANQTLSAPVRVPVVAAPPPPKLAGVSFGEPTVGVALEDIMLLCRAVADGVVDAQAVEWNQSWLRQKAKLDGKGFSVPGVRRTETQGVTVRA